MNYLGVDTETEDGKLWCTGIATRDYRHATREWGDVQDIVVNQSTPVFHNAGFDTEVLGWHRFRWWCCLRQ